MKILDDPMNHNTRYKTDSSPQGYLTAFVVGSLVATALFAFAAISTYMIFRVDVIAALKDGSDMMRAIKLVISLLFVGVALATSSFVRSKTNRGDPSAWLKEKIEKIKQ